MESNFNSGFLDCGLGDQQKQLQKQCVGIIQGTEVLGKVTGALICLVQSMEAPRMPRDRNLREKESRLEFVLF